MIKRDVNRIKPFCDEFADFITKINEEYLKGNFDIDLDKEIEDNLSSIITKKEYKIFYNILYPILIFFIQHGLE